MSYPASEVATTFVAFCNEHGDLLTNLKLQKLLYYAQGWHLALKGEVLFPEPLEAWIHGPVCPVVYQIYKRFGHKPIDVDADLKNCPKELVEHITDVWEAYGEFTAFDLERMTHRELPWSKARVGLSPDTPSTLPLDVADMKAFFVGELANGKDH